MRRVVHFAIVAVLATEALMLAQNGDASKVLADVRHALGADKTDSVKALSAIGRSTRTRPDGTSAESEFEMSVELPDKYMKRDVVVAMGPTTIYRNSGFNGDGLINETDVPPALSSGGNVRIMMAPGMTPAGANTTPEQIAEAKRKTLIGYKQDFMRLSLGMFGSGSNTYPVTFEYAGHAESADGTADVLDVKGDGGFAAKLFVDANTHLPLMLSWMDKEPLAMQVGPGTGRAGSGSASSSGSGGQVIQFNNGGGARPSPEEMDRMQKDMADRMKEAEAKRRTVEFRMFYGDYRTVDGVKLPMHIQRMVDGAPTEELTFDKIKVNPKIDPKKFTVSK